MLRSWRIGSAFGIPVYIHSSFLLAPLLVLMLNNGGGGLVGGMFLVAMVVAVFGCVLLHEFGHALMARYFGINTRDITLYPIGGVARLESMSEKPHEEILIALAGPAVNVLIAALLTPVILVGLVTGAVSGDPTQMSLGGAWAVLANFAFGLWTMNIFLVIFNLIPAFPMDGGRVLRALLSMGLGFPRATEIAVRVGMVLAFIMGAGGLFLPNPNYMLPVLALFVIMAGQQELLVVRYREQMKLAQQRRSAMPASGPIVLSLYEPQPVGRAVEVSPPVPAPVQPRRSTEPPLIFHFRVIEIPEPPR